ncbi:MAG: TrkA family potassium uptake protein [Roseiflexaceae bacterium]|nr:TrkA family potassium uptake protein [Roseiflexaceae bacterium]
MPGLNTNNHEYVVIGLGRFGASVALTLSEQGHSVLGIDSDQQVAQSMADQLTRVVVLDSTDEVALRAVDIVSFDTVIVAIGTNFEANLMTTAALKDLGVRQIICKALTVRQGSILTRVGATRIILPEHESGQRLARELSAPWIADQIAINDEHCISQILVPPKLDGRSIQEADLRRRYRLETLVVLRNGQLTILPPPDYLLVEGDTLAVVGTNAAVARLIRAWS